ncbi:MAG: isoaspartyl peptidase/L-asparaginase [bacterium]
MNGNVFGIICHGGAGVITDPKASADGLAEALEASYRLLRQSADALDAVVEAVRLMEDNPVFNCGTGSTLTASGRVEMEAAVMTQAGGFGGVIALTGVRNPVLVARKVMSETDHMLLAGEGATAFARKCGFEDYDPVTDRSRRRLEELLAKGESPYFDLEKAKKYGTAGAVAIDRRGRLAVATSTGGITGRMTGRVGDSAVPGAGTWAGPTGAVSCTGHGEAILRLMLARELVERMKTMPASVATTLAMAEARRRKFAVGAVGLDARAGFAFGHTTPDMAYGYMIADKLFMFTDGKDRRKAT